MKNNVNMLGINKAARGFIDITAFHLLLQINQQVISYYGNKTNTEYYMAARRYKIFLRVFKNIFRVSAANKWNILIFNTRREISYLQAAM